MGAGICGDCYRAVEAHHPGYWPQGDPVKRRLQLVLVEKIRELSWEDLERVREYIAEILTLQAEMEVPRV